MTPRRISSLESIVELIIKNYTYQQIVAAKGYKSVNCLKVTLCHNGLSYKRIMHYHYIENKNPAEIVHICEQERRKKRLFLR